MILVPINYTGPPTSRPPVAEVSPAAMPGTAWVSTSYAYKCSWDGKQITCASGPETAPEPSVLFRRNYAGVFDAVNVNGHLLELLHGENKNEIVNGVKMTNTVDNYSGDNCFSGIQPDGSYQDCWAHYYGFVVIQRDGVGLGPVVWPQNGYLDSAGKLASNGVRHPSMIVANGYLWVFYLDSTVGIAVARSPLSANGDPSSFQTYTATGWHYSLPGDPHQAATLKLKAPYPYGILGAGHPQRSYFFSVVSDGRGGFIGLEYGEPTPGTFGTQVWTSPDLTHWTKSGAPIWTAPSYGALSIRWGRPRADGTALAVDGGGSVGWVRWQ